MKTFSSYEEEMQDLITKRVEAVYQHHIEVDRRVRNGDAVCGLDTNLGPDSPEETRKFWAEFARVKKKWGR